MTTTNYYIIWFTDQLLIYFLWLFWQSLTSAVELEDSVGEAVIHNNMGLAYEMLNNLEQAQEHYEKVHTLKCLYR